MNAECLSISQQMRGEAPVFVVGVPRSGTTALRRTLAQHPRFIGKSPRGPETRIFLEPSRAYKIRKSSGERLLRYFLEDHTQAKAMLDALGPKPKRADHHGRENDGAANFATSGRADLVRVFFHFANQARGADRILEKTPEHVLRLAEIRETFPNAHTILCIRNPVDVLSSFRKRKAKEEAKGRPAEEIAWMGVSVDDFIERYRDETARVLRERAEHPERSTLVRYEDLTSDPEATLRRICDDIGEPFDQDAMLERDVSRDDTGSPRPQGRIIANPRSYEPYLSREDAIRVESALRDVLPTLGYTPCTSTSGPESS